MVQPLVLETGHKRNSNEIYPSTGFSLLESDSDTDQKNWKKFSSFGEEMKKSQHLFFGINISNPSNALRNP